LELSRFSGRCGALSALKAANAPPLYLSNVYLHYIFDLWVEAWRKKVANGDVIVVRNADDFVVGFQHRADAERFLEELRERLAKFGLALHADKTRLIPSPGHRNRAG
jgi:hypothetical protein